MTAMIYATFEGDCKGCGDTYCLKEQLKNTGSAMNYQQLKDNFPSVSFDRGTASVLCSHSFDHKCQARVSFTAVGEPCKQCDGTGETGPNGTMCRDCFGSLVKIY